MHQDNNVIQDLLQLISQTINLFTSHLNYQIMCLVSLHQQIKPLHYVIKVKSFKKSITQQKHVLWHIKSNFQYSIFIKFISIFFQMFQYCITNIKRQIHSQISISIDLTLQTMKNSNVHYNGGGSIHKCHHCVPSFQ
jgi:hypothetical protein